MYDHQQESESEEKVAQSASKVGIQRVNQNPEFQKELQLKEAIQRRPNNTGLPDHLKSGIENLSGHSLDDVKVHYDSNKPAQLNAHAYAQGNQIHLASGQEKHLAHEAWHVVQQKQGRVKPTVNVNGASINDNVGLEKEADVMGGKALQMRLGVKNEQLEKSTKSIIKSGALVQRKLYKMTRKLPLEVNSKEKSSKDTWIKFIDALRLRYPLLRKLTSEEEGDSSKSDNPRGEVFLKAKSDLASKLNFDDETQLHSVKSAHVAGISKEKRKRVGSVNNKISKMVSDITWIGAHLVKDAWGGMDNMMNVVAWPQEAEDKWSQSFEDPIDNAFLFGEVSKAFMEIDVTKDDEVLSRNQANVLLGQGLVASGISATDSQKKYLEQEVEKKRWEVNHAVETVPVITEGSSTLAPKVIIPSNLSGYSLAYEKAREVVWFDLNGNLQGLTKVNINALSNAKSQDDVEKSKNTVRTKERVKAIIEEKNNLQPDVFSQDLEKISS